MGRLGNGAAGATGVVLLQAVRFAVELAAAASVTAWGYVVVTGPTGWMLGAVCGAAFVACWGRFVAPKAPTRLDDPARLAVEIVLFVAASLAAARVVSPAVGAVFGLVAVVDAVVLRAVERRDVADTATPSATPQERA